MAKGKFDYLTFFYKAFIVFLFIAQGYSLFFLAINLFTLSVNALVMIYLSFRFYLLVNLSKKASKASMSLPEFLAKRNIECAKCKGEC